jgi:nucleotidyltransferase/DNA polymerase involved in DNA repair
LFDHSARSIQIKGIGKVTALHLQSLSIQTVNDIYLKRGILKLIEYPSTFDFLMRVCHGCGSTAIEHDDLQKSIGHET